MVAIAKESKITANTFHNVEGYETSPFLPAYKLACHSVMNDGWEHRKHSWVRKKGQFIYYSNQQLSDFQHIWVTSSCPKSCGAKADGIR